MKILFIHGFEKLKEDKDGNYYTDGSYNMKVWERYLQISQNLTTLFRKERHIYEVTNAKRDFQYFDKEKIQFVEIPNLRESIESFISIKKRRQLKQIIKRQVIDNDCIIARVPSQESYYAIKMAKKYYKKVLIEVVGCAWDTYWYNNIVSKLFAVKEYFALKKIVKNASYVTYVSSNFLQKRYPTHGVSLSCSDVVIHQLNETDLQNRLSRGVNKDQVKLATIGSTKVKYKGQRYVIKAMAKLKKEGFNFQYYLIGGGSTNRLEKYAKKYHVLNQIKFVGQLKHEDLIEKLKEIDIYIQPSDAESHGRAILEAFSVGCPVIGSSTGGIPELVDSKYVFKRKNVNDLTQKMRKMLEENEVQQQAKRNFEFCEKFLYNKLEKERQNFYNKIFKE